MKHSIFIQVLLSSIVVLSGCASQQIANTRQMDAEALKQVASTTQTPQQVCDTAGTAVASAQKEELDFFAPLHLDQATDNLEQGLKLIKKKQTEIEGMKACFKASTLVDNGLAIKVKVATVLNPVLDELGMLKLIDEANKYSDDIQDHIEDIIGLVKKIETGKINEAMEGQLKIIKQMQELEIEIVMDKSITPVEAMLEKAEDENADDLAEKTFEKAEQELESARKYIRANYRSAELVKKSSEAALRAAKHAFYVAKEVETFKELKVESAEEKVLYIESLLERINQKFNQQLVIGHSLYDQSTIIGQRLDALIETNEAQAKELGLLKQRQCDNTMGVEALKPVDESIVSDINRVNDEVKTDSDEE